MSLVAHDVATYLQTNSIGTIGTDIFVGMRPSQAPNDCIILYDTEGGKDEFEYELREPHIQCYVRNEDYDTGVEVIESIYALIHGKANYQLTATSDHIYFSEGIQHPGHIGRSDENLDEFTVNFRFKLRE